MLLSPNMKMRNAVIIGAILLELAVGFLVEPDQTHLRTTDFVNFYGAATIIREGNAATLYTRQTQDKTLRAIQKSDGWQYFLHPPFEASLLSPLAHASLRDAYRIWLLINFALLAAYPFIVSPSLPLVTRRPYFGWLGLAFLPALIALALGQDSVILLLVITFSYLQFRKKQDFAAGLLLALAAIKFQYLLVFVILILASRKFRFLAGVIVGSTFLIILSAAIFSIDGLVQYVRFVHDFDIHSGYGSLNPMLMVNWRGFLAGMTGRIDLRMWSFIGEVFLIISGIAFLQFMRKPSNPALLFAFYVALAVIAAPYAHFPDMTLLLLPVLLVIDWALWRNRWELREKILIFSTVMIFGLPFILLFVGGEHWWESKPYFNFAAIALFLIATAWNLAATSSPPLANGFLPSAARRPRADNPN